MLSSVRNTARRVLAMIRHMSLPKIMMMLFVICAFLPGIAQDETAEDQDQAYRYHIPFPESNFRGDWQFTLVAGPDLASDYTLTVHSYNFFGEPLHDPQVLNFTAGKPYFWQETPGAAKVAAALEVQTRILESTVPLSGVLWVYDPTSDVLNAVSLTDVVRNELIMPHIPSDFLSWSTSFSIAGVGGDVNQIADIAFDYFSNTRSGNTTAWSGLEANAYHNGTPFRDILISDVDAVTWGKVSVQDGASDFRLAGYQTYLKSKDGVQSAAIELVDEPVHKGYFGFSRHETWQFSDWFAFTNPHDGPVDINMTLFYVSGEGDNQVMTANQIITLPARNRYNYVLGLNLFDEVEGLPIGLEYSAFQPIVNEDAEPVEMPVLITHLQSDVDSTALGAHAPQERGNRTVVFLTERFDQRVDLYNPSIGESDSVDVIVHYADGQDPLVKQVEVPAGQNVTVSYSQLIEDIKASLPEETELVVEDALRVEINSPRGLFYIKLTGYQDGDYGIVNPKTRYVRVEF